jgi:hypothetical protein
LLDGLKLATEHHDNDAMGRAYVNLAGVLLTHRRDHEARQYLVQGLAHCEACDLLASSDQLIAIRASWYFERGQWAEAEHDARCVLSTSAHSAATLRALRVLSLIEARRGEATAAATLDRAKRLAHQADEAETLVPIGLARAELAWLSGDPDQTVEAALPLLDVADQRSHPWWIGETALWLDRAGALDSVPAAAALPYRHLIHGQWEDAARYWRIHGRPYEQADALAAAPDRAHRREAWEILNRLGAAHRAELVAQGLNR